MKQAVREADRQDGLLVWVAGTELQKEEGDWRDGEFSEGLRGVFDTPAFVGTGLTFVGVEGWDEDTGRPAYRIG